MPNCEFAVDHKVRMLVATRMCSLDGSVCGFFDDAPVYEKCPTRKEKLAEIKEK